MTTSHELEGLKNIVDETMRHPDAIRLALAGLQGERDYGGRLMYEANRSWLKIQRYEDRPLWHDDCLPEEA